MDRFLAVRGEGGEQALRNRGDFGVAAEMLPAARNDAHGRRRRVESLDFLEVPRREQRVPPKLLDGLWCQSQLEWALCHDPQSGGNKRWQVCRTQSSKALKARLHASVDAVYIHAGERVIRREYLNVIGQGPGPARDVAMHVCAKYEGMFSAQGLNLCGI
jgi:hypothetical protein